MKNILLTALLALCTSCTSLPFPDTKKMVISIHQIEGGDKDNLGYAVIQGNTCKVFLRQYPKCLTHEIRHCFEGNWHEGRDSVEYC